MSELVQCLLLLSILIISQVANCQFLERQKNARQDAPHPPNFQSTGGAYISEELWPREKSLIKIKIIHPTPRVIDVWESRKQENYLNDLNLDFDSPFRTTSVDNCTLDFRSYYDGSTDISTHADLRTSAGNIQLQISGGSRCKVLPLHAISRQERDNLTHLVVRDTAIQTIPRFLFGKAGLERLLRLDVIDNGHLREIKSRAFDGLARLTYLSLINNAAIEHLDIESFAGLKGLEEMIFVGNGKLWSSFLFQSVLSAASVRILPNLVHLHISGSRVISHTQEAERREDDGADIRSENNAAGSESQGQGMRSERRGQEPLNNKKSLPTTLSSASSADHDAAPLVRLSSDDRVVKIGKDDLKQLSQVKYLQLSSCDLTFVHPRAFLPLLKNLLALNLVSIICMF